MTNAPPCLTVRKAAAQLGVSSRTVYNLVGDGHIGHLRLPGGGIRIRTSDLEAFEARHWHAPNVNEDTADNSASIPNATPLNRDAYQRGQATRTRLKNS